MNEQEYHRMRAVEDEGWWFAGKRFLVERLLRQAVGSDQSSRVLDVGCGTGATLGMLARFGRTFGADMAPAALRFASERRSALLSASDGQRLAFRDGAFGIVTALDVIEHLDDPVAALREMQRVCEPGGVVLLAVPAHPGLWSDHDVALAHRRRYTARMLREHVEAAGLRVERLTCAYAAFFLPALVWRRLRRLLPGRRAPEADLGRVAGPLNTLLAGYMRLEAGFLGIAGLPIGTSLLCVARKVDHQGG